MKKTAILIPALLLASTMAANADGLYISGQIGSSSLDHTIERNTGGLALPVPDTSGVTRASDSNVSVGLGIGYTIDLPNSFFVGAEGFFNYEDQNIRNINGVLVTDIDVDFSYGGRLLAGAHVTDRFSIYAHGGATVLDFDVENSYTFAPPVRNVSRTEVGFSYGIGADYKIDDNFSVFAEYTQMNDVGFEPIGEVAGDTGRLNPNDLDLNRLSLGIKYSF